MKKEMTASLSEKKFDWKLKSEVDRYEIVLSFIECQWTNQHFENGTKEIKYVLLTVAKNMYVRVCVSSSNKLLHCFFVFVFFFLFFC